MAQVLSQDEVDALLNAVNDGGGGDMMSSGDSGGSSSRLGGSAFGDDPEQNIQN